jgi:hypothetical protein
MIRELHNADKTTAKTGRPAVTASTAAASAVATLNAVR